MGSVRCKVENGVVTEYHKVVVYRFRVSDVDDPQLYAAQPLWEWQQSDSGQFVMEHATETPVWRSAVDYNVWGHQFVIIAELEKKKLSEYYLRWGNVDGNI